MVEHLMVHAADDTQLVRMFLQKGQRVADLDPRRPAARKHLTAAHQLLLLDVGELRLKPMKLSRRRLAVVGRKRRLGVEGIDLARTTMHEKLDDRFGARGKFRSFGSERRSGEGR